MNNPDDELKKRFEKDNTSDLLTNDDNNYCSKEQLKIINSLVEKGRIPFLFCFSGYGCTFCVPINGKTNEQLTPVVAEFGPISSEIINLKTSSKSGEQIRLLVKKLVEDLDKNE